MNTKTALLYLVLFSFIGCQSGQTKTAPQTTVKEGNTPISKSEQFNKYWYSGKAELSSYTLKQARYGEIRDGEVVLVFVTEPFSVSKQVKLDNPQKAGNDNVSVLKLNQVRKFNTGIYDYSIVTSTFTPIDTKNYPFTLKASTSIQEWCGHTFTQLNLADDKYNFKQFSYFEADGDEEKTINATFLEEALFTKIRIAKGQLPEGEINLIPSTIYSRFNYKKMDVEKAEISKTTSEKTFTYKVKYLNINRTLTIDVEKEFPYKISGFTEVDGTGLTTTAKLKATSNEPYWEQKKLSDQDKRKALKLKYE
ncbi:septum formation inhibitor Maf [Polaribacter undariae]|uniref:Septum formation inhibitor Maf n=1 Tax=Polaribacter sejongensis TaxID=985043 RepID=A0AAJ1QUI8_9FLAO|nr:septum formation inhibitor Maf [Polaribacter undariae]MDN3618325.1 septum formation inhibitor Maf [Polaribacter undariae]UWD30689.1 septum formation inhibitor Maf [Polaribacter undariae]